MKKTGEKIKALCKEKNITVKDVQRELFISAHQSIYDWFAGKSLPSVDNMYRLSKLLQVHMEDLIVEPEKPVVEAQKMKRLLLYYQELLRYSRNFFHHDVSPVTVLTGQ